MKCVAIISSPFQLFSFNELINQKNINNYFLFVLVYNHYELLQIKNLAYVQFHPTLLYSNVNNDTFQITEAIRGKGAKLKNIYGS